MSNVQFNSFYASLMKQFLCIREARNRSTGGSGLGLYLVKMILDRMRDYSVISLAESKEPEPVSKRTAA